MLIVSTRVLRLCGLTPAPVIDCRQMALHTFYVHILQCKISHMKVQVNHLNCSVLKGTFYSFWGIKLIFFFLHLIGNKFRERFLISSDFVNLCFMIVQLCVQPRVVYNPEMPPEQGRYLVSLRLILTYGPVFAFDSKNFKEYFLICLFIDIKVRICGFRIHGSGFSNRAVNNFL